MALPVGWRVGAHLRTTKASEGSVAGNVGLAAISNHPHIGDLVCSIHVQQGTVHDGCAQVQTIPSVVVQLALQCLHLSRLVKSNLRTKQML